MRIVAISPLALAEVCETYHPRTRASTSRGTPTAVVGPPHAAFARCSSTHMSDAHGEGITTPDSYEGAKTMNKLVITLAVALLWPATSFAQINVPHVFLGFTAAMFDGDQGVLTYHQACAAEFTNSRMCASKEILQSPTTPSGLSGTAWVQPTFSPAASNGASPAAAPRSWSARAT